VTLACWFKVKLILSQQVNP